MSDKLSWTQVRERVTERAGGRCEYCRSPFSYATQSFAVEHILPTARGGTDALDNLALSCQGCNNHKFTKVTGHDPATAEEVPLFNPRNQFWREHFAWSEDSLRVIGLTPTGRATVEELQLNREGVMNLRRALRAVGVHPPTEPGPLTDPVPPAGNGPDGVQA